MGRYPAHCESTLCYKSLALSSSAKSQMRAAATKAAVAASATMKMHSEPDVLAKVKKAANDAVHPLVIVEVKELTAKAAAQSHVTSTKQKVTQEIAKAAAKSAAKSVAHDAVKVSKEIARVAAEDAVRTAVQKIGSKHVASSPSQVQMDQEDMTLITKEAIASDVKDALDHQGHTNGVDAESEEMGSK